MKRLTTLAQSQLSVATTDADGFEILSDRCNRSPRHFTLSSLDMTQTREIEMEGKNKGVFGHSTVN